MSASHSITDCFSTLTTEGCVAIRAKTNWKTGFNTSEELTKSIHLSPRKYTVLQELLKVSGNLEAC